MGTREQHATCTRTWHTQLERMPHLPSSNRTKTQYSMPRCLSKRGRSNYNYCADVRTHNMHTSNHTPRTTETLYKRELARHAWCSGTHEKKSLGPPGPRGCCGHGNPLRVLCNPLQPGPLPRARLNNNISTLQHPRQSFCFLFFCCLPPPLPPPLPLAGAALLRCAAASPP